MEESKPRTISPEWTETQEKNGLDPLGMQISSVGLYQTLLPGISNVSLRVRYYGYYAWLCHVYARKNGSTDPKEWQKFVRRAEALYALISQHKGGESGVAGVTWAAKALSSTNSGSIDFSSAADPGSGAPYLKQAWGAYGAAYASQLFEVGIFAESEDHELPVASEEVGQAIAHAFAQSLGNLEAELFAIINSGSVTIEQIDRLAVISPSEIPSDSDERRLYEELLFGKVGTARETDFSRRDTLLLLLNLAAQTHQGPTPEEVRWSLYTDSTLNGTPLELTTKALKEQKLLWKIYQINDLTHVAYESLFKYLLDLLEQFPSGVQPSRLIAEAVDTICKTMDTLSRNWSEYVASLPATNYTADRELCRELLLAARNKVFTEEDAISALKLLGLAYLRAKEHEDKIQSVFKELNPFSFRSVYSEINFLNEKGNSNLTELLTKLFDERILQRHLWVALRKLRTQGDYTYLIETEDARIHLREKDGPVLTNPRLGPAITFLRDLGLLDAAGITPQGRAVMEVA